MSSNSQRIKIGFFPGVFDLVHLGHIRALKEAKLKCDILVVGINANPRFENPKKNRPIMPANERKEILEAVSCVDATFVYKNDKELKEIDLTPFFNVRFMGEDHKGNKKHHKINAKIVYISREHNYSSSGLRERIVKNVRDIL